MKLFSRSGSKWRIEDKAEGYLNEIVKINPSSAGALLELGNIMLTRGKRREAMEFYQRALAQVKESAWLREIDPTDFASIFERATSVALMQTKISARFICKARRQLSSVSPCFKAARIHPFIHNVAAILATVEGDHYR